MWRASIHLSADFYAKQQLYYSVVINLYCVNSRLILNCGFCAFLSFHDGGRLFL